MSAAYRAALHAVIALSIGSFLSRVVPWGGFRMRYSVKKISLFTRLSAVIIQQVGGLDTHVVLSTTR